ncbi:MAG: ArsR/SmtB family transcription factor [Brevibacterium aurantiacum]|uniref:ArsR family transcriptional regulator n=2 Tax=Brevibacterium TaxID=1696 RepID=A0A1D7W137_BREAU|nr:MULTISPECIES: metalloregulator ArsR/SmtB family transcription factor [Brevibacterium]AOP52690.1 Transcriptional regulator, ArsR family [Brevibacterium aurantiacum]AZL05014.1 ArsR family transcriptional regulator [Brevibacterium aurantiacum]AZL08600.1 ArsR family transcriptional regulator [Brevibacterium aurantiacum]AZL12211.1 ArsR family transcriptional regulator [Brevibacterium aurantiacum]AZT92585.1 ArsR family transcriptional regulator [Brevibacterium aurantiacum]
MNLNALFGALADPTRRAMVDRLRDGDLSAGDLAEPLPISRSAVSQHLKVLEDAGLITRVKSAQRRIVHLNTGPLSAANEWLMAAHEDWQQRFDNLDQVLAEEK